MEKVEQVTSARVLDPDSIKVFPVTLTGKNKRPQWKYIYHEMNYRQQVTQRHVCNKNYRSLIWHVISWPPHLPLSSSHTHKNGHSDKAQIYEQTNDILSSSCKSVILCVVFFLCGWWCFFFPFWCWCSPTVTGKKELRGVEGREKGSLVYCVKAAQMQKTLICWCGKVKSTGSQRHHVKGIFLLCPVLHWTST